MVRGIWAEPRSDQIDVRVAEICVCVWGGVVVLEPRW